MTLNSWEENVGILTRLGVLGSVSTTTQDSNEGDCIPLDDPGEEEGTELASAPCGPVVTPHP